MENGLENIFLQFSPVLIQSRFYIYSCGQDHTGGHAVNDDSFCTLCRSIIISIYTLNRWFSHWRYQILNRNRKVFWIFIYRRLNRRWPRNNHFSSFQFHDKYSILIEFPNCHLAWHQIYKAIWLKKISIPIHTEVFYLMSEMKAFSGFAKWTQDVLVDFWPSYWLDEQRLRTSRVDRGS